MDDHVERKGAMASQVLKSMHWSYFKLVVIKHVEETSSCPTAQKFSVMEPNLWRWRKQNVLLQGANLTWKAFHEPKHGNFNAVDKNVL
jgi:hypothetical protein